MLAVIADHEAALGTDGRRQAQLKAEARDNRHLAREAKRKFAGTRHELQRYLPLIDATVEAAQNLTKREAFERTLRAFEQRSSTKFPAAIRCLLNGERGPDVLCTDLNLEDSMIIETILAALADPSTLEGLVPRDP